MKDRARNGGRDLTLLHEHIAKDDLVAWGWDPGRGRMPAPGTQALLKAEELSESGQTFRATFGRGSLRYAFSVS